MKNGSFKASPQGVAFIKGWEGCAKVRPDGRIQSYLCPAGVWTIGWGTTLGVTPGMIITVGQAAAYFSRDLMKFEAAVNAAVRVSINQQMFDALVSFTYNVGIKAFSDSTLLRLLNQRDYRGAADQFKRWNRSGGRVTNGLTRRRAAEEALFLSR